MGANHDLDGDISLATSTSGLGDSHSLRLDGRGSKLRGLASASGLARSQSLGSNLSSRLSDSRIATPTSRLGWNRQPGEPRPPPLVSDRVRCRIDRWVKEILICNFDLEKGPVVERGLLGQRWGPGERANIAFSSFPDTSLFAEGTTTFSFRLRHTPPDPDEPDPLSPGLEIGGQSAEGINGAMSVSQSLPAITKSERSDEYRQWDELGGQWLYGYVWFEQRKDESVARGYMQKSLVFLTQKPWPSLYLTVLHRIAPLFFAHGYASLEAACHEIAQWPDPGSLGVVHLPVGGLMVDVCFRQEDCPRGSRVIQAWQSPPPNPNVIRSLVASLWTIWECLILAEPLVIFAPDPKTCSELVWWLGSLSMPIPTAGDRRPYLHIHDRDYALLVNTGRPQQGTLIGVTNPFFRNVTSHWPNVISVSAKGEAVFSTRRHRSISKSRHLLAEFERDIGAEGSLARVQRHFQQQTERFLVPINRYFQTLLSSTQPVRPWSIPDFLSHLKRHAPNPITFRTRGLLGKARMEADFYTAFCLSASFSSWLVASVDSAAVTHADNSTRTSEDRKSASSEVISGRGSEASSRPHSHDYGRRGSESQL